MATSPSKSSRVIIDQVVGQYIRGCSAQVGCKPGFAHAMKLSYNTIDPSNMSLDDPTSDGRLDTLTYRYKLSKDVPRFTVGLCTALMDELSTLAIFRVGLPSAPGLSLQMQTQIVQCGNGKTSPAKRLLDPSRREIDIVNIVTKFGKSISFTRTDFRCTATKELLAFSSHVKFMPTNSFFLDLLFRSPFVFTQYHEWYVKPNPVPRFPERPLWEDVLLPNIKYSGKGKATFEVTPEHTNPFNGLHGGCHIMVMEIVAEMFLKEILGPIGGSTTLVLDAIQIDYLGAGKLGQLGVECEIIGGTSLDYCLDLHSIEHQELNVRVILSQGGRICSDGKLKVTAGPIHSNL